MVRHVEYTEPPRITSLKSTQPLSTFEDFGEDLYFVSDPRGYKAVVHDLANSYLKNKNGTITDPRLQLNKVCSQDGNVQYTSTKAPLEMMFFSIFSLGISLRFCDQQHK